MNLNRGSFLFSQPQPKEDEVIAKLANFPETTEKKIRRWQTPYGFSISLHPNNYFTWMYTYDEDLPFMGERNDGYLSPQEVISVLYQLWLDPDKLRRKPSSIKTLEQLTGQTAFRKLRMFGRWHIRKDGVYSLFNNPFHLSSEYTNDENVFEVWYLSREENPREYVSLDKLISQIREFGYIQEEKD